MSEFDAIAEVADNVIFGVFQEDTGTVRRGAAAPVAVDVVIERGVAVVGEYGQITTHVDMASFRNAQWRPQSGDMLMVNGRERKVDEVDQDDGLVTRVVLYG